MRLRASDHGLAGKTVSLQAIDLIDFDVPGVTARQVTQEGLISPAHISRFGIQVYRAGELGLRGVDANKLVYAYRPEAEVFDPDATRSFEFNPLANDHTKEDVGTKNWRKLVANGQVIGEVRNVARDGQHLGATIVVRDQKAIDDIVAGKSQLSCGYSFDADFTPGTFNGQPYDFVQRRIRGNHVAIVDRARGGFGCRIADRDPAANQNAGRNQMETSTQLVPVTIAGVQIYVRAEDQANANSARDAYDKMSALHKAGCDAAEALKGKFDAMKAHHKAMVAKLGKKDDDEDEEMNDSKRGKDGEDADLCALLDIKLAGIRKGVKKADDAAIADAKAKEAAATKRAADAEAKVTVENLDALVAARDAIKAGATKIVGDSFKSDGKTNDAIMAEVITHVIAKDAALKPIAQGVLAGADVSDAKSAPQVAAAFRAVVGAKGTIKAVDHSTDPVMQILSGTRPATVPGVRVADAEDDMTPQQIRSFRDSHNGFSPSELARQSTRA